MSLPSSPVERVVGKEKRQQGINTLFMVNIVVARESSMMWGHHLLYYSLILKICSWKISRDHLLSSCSTFALKPKIESALQMRFYTDHQLFAFNSPVIQITAVTQILSQISNKLKRQHDSIFFHRFLLDFIIFAVNICIYKREVERYGLWRMHNVLSSVDEQTCYSWYREHNLTALYLLGGNNWTNNFFQYLYHIDTTTAQC